MDYSYNFQDNILTSSFNSTSKRILEWIQENRDIHDWAKDPNAYEMANLFLFGAKYAHEGKNVDLDSLTQIWNIRSKDFARCNIPENSFIYAICQDAYQAAISGKSMVNDEASHAALRKMAGIGLFLKQQHRDTGVINYNNPQELLQLLQCSDTLKVIHPHLFEKYAFQKNLDTLCRLQLSQELPSEVSDSIRSAQHLVANGRDNFSTEEFSSISKLYLCSKIINDSDTIRTFLREYEKEVNLESTSEYQSPAHNYYYSLSYELSHVRSDFENENDSLEAFEKNFASIYGKYDVDLNVLLDTVNKIEALAKTPDAQGRQDLINSLDNMALAHYAKRKQSKEGNEPTDDERV